jgi:exopolysaccharide biosynthesis polyprenyl glycosylphosphotransferase
VSSVVREQGIVLDGQAVVRGRGRRETRGSSLGAIVLVGDLVAVATVWGVVGRRPVLAVFAVLVVVGQWLAGAYRFRLHVSGFREARSLVTGVGVTTLVVAPPAVLAGDTEVLVVTAGATVVALLCARGITAQVIVRARRRGRLLQPAVILGSGVVARELALRFQAHRDLGLLVVGHLDDGEDPVVMPVARLGSASDVDEVLRRTGARHVVAAFCHAREGALVELLRLVRDSGVEVHVVPRFFELGLGSGDLSAEDVWGIPLYRLPPPGERARGWRLKRAFDVVVSLLVLVLASPLMLVIAVAVKLSSPGPVLFRQHRLGQHEREFELLKFRSMTVNTDADTTWSVDGDGRVTRVGRFLRDRSLDELPQFFNVLRGDMSMVGPRPERRQFVDAFTREHDRYAARHRVPVGMTGWAQVHGLRGDTSIADRVQFDNNYIESWSLWSDLVIIARTVGVVLRGQSQPERGDP